MGEFDFIRRLGQPEVGDPDVPLKVKKQVRWLDVPVHDPLTVGVMQRLGGLNADPGYALRVVAEGPDETERTGRPG